MKKHEFVKVKRGRGFSKACGQCGQPVLSKTHAGGRFSETKDGFTLPPNAVDVLTLHTYEGGATPKLTAYEGGATRTPKAERRELMPKTAIDALARRLALGAEKHGVNNWRKGGTEFRLATINHLLDHVFEYLEHGGSENTDAIICNAAFLCEFEVREAFKGHAK